MAQPFASFHGALAIVTGSGDGMGRALCQKLISEGCSVAHCDFNAAKLDETQRILEQLSAHGVSASAHIVDVSDEQQLLRFAAETAKLHAFKGRKVALFNNAGVSGEMSIFGDRQAYERLYNVCWYGVYYSTRAFLPMLVESEHGYVVNTSSIAGFLGAIGFMEPMTSYATSKFAVRGFTEALVTDFRLNAPHIRAAVVMPGMIGTGIADTDLHFDLTKARERDEKAKASVEYLRASGASEYEELKSSGMLRLYTREAVSDATLAASLDKKREDFRTKATTTAEQAVDIILDGMRNGEWRIIVGADAKMLDKLVRKNPEDAYRATFLFGAASTSSKL